MVSLEREQQPNITTKEATQTVAVKASLWTQKWTDGWIKRWRDRLPKHNDAIYTSSTSTTTKVILHAYLQAKSQVDVEMSYNERVRLTLSEECQHPLAKLFQALRRTQCEWPERRKKGSKRELNVAFVFGFQKKKITSTVENKEVREKHFGAPERKKRARSPW